jgi:RNA polymerase sigma-54 factor
MRMEIGLSQHQALKQIQTLSPQMYMSMEILCMNSLDLEERVDTELQENETLEIEEPRASESSADGATATAGDTASGDLAGGETAGGDTATAESADDSFDKRFEQWDQFSREEFATSRSRSSYQGEKDEKLEALSNTEGRPVSLQEHLENTLHLLGDEEIQVVAAQTFELGLLAERGEPTKDEALGKERGSEQSDSEDARVELPLDAARLVEVRDLAAEVIYNIDNRGYLMYSLEEIRESQDPKPSLGSLRISLGIVQGLEPPGIGGRGLQECLLLQLRRDKQDYPVEERIIRDHLDDLGHNRLPKIARAIGISIDEVKDAMETIGSLDPLPGKLFGGEMPRYVKPDVTVEEIEGKYEVRVENEYLPRLRVSPHYRALYKESRKNPEVKKYLKKKMDSAEWLMAAIRQRQSTLHRIAQEIVGIQFGFLDEGISHLKPLKMADIADIIGVHVSTVSRAISDKYIQTARGIYPLKFFFTGGATKSDGNVEARGAVIQRIKDLIAQEDKKSPMSDISIVEKLEESGIHISRRTVTKYREAESIPSSRERRAY